MKDDTISRQAAILAIKTRQWLTEGAKEALADQLERLPSAQSERKTGRWLTSDDMYETGVCSVCKCDSQEPVSYTITMFKYCPNCGAKMEENE